MKILGYFSPRKVFEITSANFLNDQEKQFTIKTNQQIALICQNIRIKRKLVESFNETKV